MLNTMKKKREMNQDNISMDTINSLVRLEKKKDQLKRKQFKRLQIKIINKKFRNMKNSILTWLKKKLIIY